MKGSEKMLFKKCISVLLSLSIVMLTLCAVGVYNVKAIDNYDGDISKKVEVDIKKEKIIYKVRTF